jgi:hypothetical protein
LAVRIALLERQLERGHVLPAFRFGEKLPTLRGIVRSMNCFLNCLLPKEVAGAIGFHIDEIQKEFLRAS